MQRLTMLVSPEGQWLLPESEEFFQLLNDPAPDYDAVAFAVKNLGCIKFDVVEKSIIELELHPRIVELSALLAAQQAIVQSNVSLFRLKFFDGAWQSEISSSPEHIVGRLSELCTPEFSPPATDRFLVEPRDMSTLFCDDDNVLRPLAQKWRVAFAQFDPSVVGLAVTQNLLPRLMIAGIRPPQGEPTWRFIGNGHRWIGNDYQLRGVGESVQNMPDKDYGAWATEYYKSVATSHLPRYDVVTGTIQFEDEAGRPRRSYRYERLMLPWKTPSGEVLVTMCSRPMGNVAPKSSGASTPPLSMNAAISE